MSLAGAGLTVIHCLRQSGLGTSDEGDSSALESCEQTKVIRLETKYLLGPPCQFSLSTGHSGHGLGSSFFFLNLNLAGTLMRDCEEFEQEN